MFSVLSGLFLMISIGQVWSTEVPGIGTCPRVNIIQNFDLSRFFGRWYEICAYPNKLTIGGKCVYSIFSWTQTNGITVYNKQISLGKEKQYLGTATVVSNGVLGVTYPAYRKFHSSSQSSKDLTLFSAKANAYYNILDTDYENFAVVFSCNNYYG